MLLKFGDNNQPLLIRPKANLISCYRDNIDKIQLNLDSLGGWNEEYGFASTGQEVAPQPCICRNSQLDPERKYLEGENEIYREFYYIQNTNPERVIR
ncbi:hypothetical protein AAW31_03990 [Nitrosomonas communis]|uniref:Uncharacterized protein n=1 Tax=Nitrosomonas communis TaxID=44574 RepID=A0A0F7KEB7_9PROT|nr:hypothetical protein AAW31_03990 [Nitrosomonas communis]